MQIRTQLNDCPRSACENVVQKVSPTAYARENEIRFDVNYEIMYIQVSSYRRDLHRKHYKWSLCSIDKFKSNCSFLIKYLLLNSFLFGKRFLEKFHRSTVRKSQHESDFHSYSVRALDPDENIHRCQLESTHKSLMIDKSFILLMHFTAHRQHQSTIRSTNFHRKLYKVLLNFFYEYFNNKTNCHRNHQKVYLNPQSSINTFCDLSTNSKNRNILFIIDSISGIEHHRPQQIHHRFVVRSTSLLRTLNFLYGLLLIQRHVMCNNSYEFSDNHHNVKQHILLQLLAHNQMILYVTTTWNYHRTHHQMQFQMPDDKSCHEIENAISTLATTSNHKLKATAPNDNDTCHQGSEKFSNCYQQFHRTFRSNDSVKSHLNAILFLIILCIPLLTAATNVHNLKYSTNVVKTKYGPLRGIILRSTPTVEGYLGVPYGE